MLINYRPYYWLVFTAVTNLAGEKIGAENIKDNRLFLLNKSNKLQKQFKVNTVKQRNTVLIHIANDIEKHQVLLILQPKLILTIIKPYYSAPTNPQLSLTLIYSATKKYFYFRPWIQVG